MNKLELYIRGVIGFDVTAGYIQHQLACFQGDTIIAHIDTAGGKIDEGLSIYNAIKSHKATTKICIIEGSCMSMGTIIMLAFDKIQAMFASLIMVHLPSSYLPNNSTAEELESEAKFLREVESLAIELYKTRLSLSDSKIRKLLEDTTYLSPMSALELGLIDEVLDAPKAEMMFKSLAIMCGDTFKDEIFNQANRLELNNNQQKKEKMKIKNQKDLSTFLGSFRAKLSAEDQVDLDAQLSEVEIEGEAPAPQAPEPTPAPIPPVPATPAPAPQAPEPAPVPPVPSSEVAEMRAEMIAMKAEMKAKNEHFEKMMFGQGGQFQQQQTKTLKGAERAKAAYATMLKGVK